MDETKDVSVEEELNTDEVTEEIADDDDSLEAILKEMDSDSEEESSDEEKSGEKEGEKDVDLLKQINDLKAELGRTKKLAKDALEKKSEKPTNKETLNPKEGDGFNVNEAMAEDILIAGNPEVKEILSTLKAHAKKLNTDVYTLYKTDETYSMMAKNVANNKKKEEENIKKVNSPSEAVFENKNLDNLTDEDMEKLTPEQRLKVLQELQKREG